MKQHWHPWQPAAGHHSGWRVVQGGQERGDIMTNVDTDKIKVGDRIKITSPTRGGRVPAWRKVNGFTRRGRPTVRFHGWPDFVVDFDEIIDHQAT